ncbi:MAG: hypothetical protein OXE86_04200 [Alphaproteobacteria bacterium]|nr:hypothetical protein [Alphaproteobacteria bacterium]
MSERLKVYIPEAGALLAAWNTVHSAGEADRVRWSGKVYVVVESRSWQRGHCRATLLRED